MQLHWQHMQPQKQSRSSQISNCKGSMKQTWRDVIDVQNMSPTVPLPNDRRQVFVDELLEVQGNVVRMRGFSDARIRTHVRPTLCNCSQVLVYATTSFFVRNHPTSNIYYFICPLMLHMLLKLSISQCYTFRLLRESDACCILTWLWTQF